MYIYNIYIYIIYTHTYIHTYIHIFPILINLKLIQETAKKAYTMYSHTLKFT